MPRVLSGTLFIAALTARSQAYAQAMARCGVSPMRTVFLGEDGARVPGRGPGSAIAVELPAGLVAADLSEPLEATAKREGWACEHVRGMDVNSDQLAAAIDRIAPKLVIYSGYGGQIVGRPLLERGIPMLHVHAGWLPRYRGSTTVYYEMLNDRRCSASAILLRPELDAGPILARKHFPAPAEGIDVDYVYDPAIRASLLVDVLRGYADAGSLPQPVAQSPEEATTYFVIHPVLKHIAMLAPR